MVRLPRLHLVSDALASTGRRQKSAVTTMAGGPVRRLPSRAPVHQALAPPRHQHQFVPILGKKPGVLAPQPRRSPCDECRFVWSWFLVGCWRRQQI